MDGFELFQKHQWFPFGTSSQFLAVEQHTVIYTWVALGIITLIAVGGRVALAHPQSLPGYVVHKIIRMVMRSIEQSCQGFSYRYCAFIVTLCLFLIVCNCIVILPTMEEPTKDLNTTVALALITFFYVQREAIRTHGVVAYLNEYFKTPLSITGYTTTYSAGTIIVLVMRCMLNAIIALLTFPIELLGKLASILSLSFRLYGNIFGGAVINNLWMHFKSGSLLLQIIGLVSGFNLILILFFGLFEGLIQAFVFSMLSLMYLSSAVAPHHNTE